MTPPQRGIKVLTQKTKFLLGLEYFVPPPKGGGGYTVRIANTNNKKAPIAGGLAAINSCG